MKKSTYCIIVIVLVSWIVGNVTAQESERMKPALLVIDIQNQYLPLMSDDGKDVAMLMINYAISIFREHGYPVIRVYHTDPKMGPAPDTEAFEFPETVTIKEDDPKIVKTYPSAFKKTDLEKMLKDMDRNTVFLCGLSAVGCVMATRYSAMDLDFNTFMIKDALLSHKAEYTDAVEDIFNAVGLGVVQTMLVNAVK